MDDKQGLTPDLKQAYDRIMNTPAPATSAPATPPSQATSPQAPAPQPPIPAPGPSVTPPSAAPMTPNAATPTTPNATPPQQEGAHAPFLSSVPPHPVAQTGSFSFSDKKPQTPAPATHPGAALGGTSAVVAANKKLSGPIVAILITVLVVAWTVFWAKFFNIF